MRSTDKFNFGHAVSAFVHNFHPGDMRVERPA